AFTHSRVHLHLNISLLRIRRSRRAAHLLLFAACGARIPQEPSQKTTDSQIRCIAQKVLQRFPKQFTAGRLTRMRRTRTMRASFGMQGAGEASEWNLALACHRLKCYKAKKRRIR